MKTYKSIEHLRARAIKNNGKPVEIWDDEGIKVNGKIYRQMEYGNMEHNFKGNSYVTFRNTGKKGRQKTYANRENFDYEKDSFITIEYNLLPKDETEPHKCNIFQFVLIRETY